jgi:hypothetical protein
MSVIEQQQEKKDARVKEIQIKSQAQELSKRREY